MDQAKLTSYQSRLETELTELTSDLKTIATLSPDTGDWVAVPANTNAETADENLESDNVEDWNERRATVSQLETRYQNIVRALDKIKTGKFGICEISGETIEEARLDANPAARTNIANRDREHELSL
jgi:RNA polymerase-binding transcription factor DksA